MGCGSECKHAHAAPPACGHRSCLAVFSMMLLSGVCGVCGVRGQVHVEPSCSDGACRHLTADNEGAHATSFTDTLGTERPSAHVVGLWRENHAEEDVVEWLLATMSERCSVTASEEEEDPHAGHDHRRRLQSAAAAGGSLRDAGPRRRLPALLAASRAATVDDAVLREMHARRMAQPTAADTATAAASGGAVPLPRGRRLHDAHAGHDHGDEAESTLDAATAEEDDHAGHDHGDHDDHGAETTEATLADPASATADGAHDDHAGHDHSAEPGEQRLLSLAGLRSARTPGSGNEAAARQAMLLIAACVADSACTLEGEGTEHDDRKVGDARDLLGLKCGLAAVFLVMTVLASFLPFIFRASRNFKGLISVLNCFSGAVFLTVGLTHLIPHVIEYQALARPSMDYPLGLTLVVIGFLLILGVEQILFDVHGADLEQRARGAADEGKGYALLHKSISMGVRFQDPLITETALVVHAVLESVVLGLTIKRDDLLLFFGSIMLHKVFSSVSIATRFIRRGATPLQTTVLLLPYHLLPPLAVILGALVGSEDALTSLVLSGLAAGTFLYIGAFEVLCEEFVEAEVHGPEDGGVARDDADGVVEGKPVIDEDRGGAWAPSKALRFAAFVAGAGLLMGLTAALPEGEHNHG